MNAGIEFCLPLRIVFLRLIQLAHVSVSAESLDELYRHGAADPSDHARADAGLDGNRSSRSMESIYGFHSKNSEP